MLELHILRMKRKTKLQNMKLRLIEINMHMILTAF